jgi:septum formation protein
LSDARPASDAGAPWGARLLGIEGVRLVLASASPRRAALLAGLGVRFTVRAVDADESLHVGESPATAARRLAEEKALAAAAALTPGDDARTARAPGNDATLTVGADTLVVLDGVALGKPLDAEDARRMLRLLSGRTHEVVTGVAVVRDADRHVISGVETTTVRFRELDADDIATLVDSGEAMDKAGAYGIQGLAALAVDGIEGDYSNVVGLPLGLLRRLVLAHGRR